MIRGWGVLLIKFVSVCLNISMSTAFCGRHFFLLCVKATFLFSVQNISNSSNQHAMLNNTQQY